MATKVLMPMLGLTMDEGTITAWLKQEGDAVEKGEGLFEITTDKANVQVEAPAGGFLLRIMEKAERTVPVGFPVGIVGAEDEDITVLLQESHDGPKPPDTEEKAVTASIGGDNGGKRVLITPRARKLAEAHHLDWRKLIGGGHEGLITEEDVQAQLDGRGEREHAPAGSVTSVKLPAGRKIIAERLRQSQRERVHIHLTIPVDMTNLLELRRDLLAVGRTVSLNDFFVKALGICLQESPGLNASLNGDEIILHHSVSIGFAVAVDDDHLVVPVVPAVEEKSVFQIADQRRGLVDKAKQGKLMPAEITGATFTLSNLGAYGVEQFTAVINPPETGIMAVGAVIEEPRAVDGQVLIRPIMRATLGVDHRLVDGAQAARFLSRFRDLLEKPQAMAV